MRSKKRPAYAWYVVFVLLIAQMFSFLDRMIMGLLVGPIRESFAISDTQYSLLAGLAFSLFYAVMGLPLARIADMGNRRNLISAGIAVWSFMTALCGLAHGYWTLFAARIGVGVGEATLGPAAYSMIADYFPKSLLARALSVYMIGVTLGSGLAYMVGGAIVGYVSNMDEIIVPVLGEMEGWQLTFFIVGVPGILISILVATTVREPERQGVAAEDSYLPLSDVVSYVMAKRRAYLGHIFGISIFIFQDILNHTGVAYSNGIWIFVFLVALGADYNIFVIARIKEETERLGFNEGIAVAVGKTGGVVTSAGIILASTFAVLTTLPLRDVFQLGMAVMLGVLIDTFVVRTLLVPSMAAILKNYSWWPSLGSRKSETTQH